MALSNGSCVDIDGAQKPNVAGSIVAVVDENTGVIMAGGFLHPGEVYAIGPVFADNAFKGRGAAKAVMVALIEQASSENAKSIRLCQTTANVVSFSLYASLDFVPVEGWMEFQGSVTTEQASFANRSCGFNALSGVEVRRMEDTDVKACNGLHCKTMSHGRDKEIRARIPGGARPGGPWVADRNGEIIAYTTGFNLTGHTVAETEEALAYLYMEVCRRTANTSLQSYLHVPGRLYPRILQWAFAAKLHMTRSYWLMVRGSYQPPLNGMVYCPSILH